MTGGDLSRAIAIWGALAATPTFGADLQATVLDESGAPLPDAVVSAFADFPVPTPKPEEDVEDQVNKEFVPYVNPVRVGTNVRFPNRDNISHHVYSFSPAKRFELPLYKGEPASPVLFDKVGVVKLGCNIHDWMIGYIYVTDAPFFGKSSNEGRVDLRGLPPGSYRLQVWHPRITTAAESETLRVTLQDETPTLIEWRLKLKREFRPPRTPLPDEPAYR
jgi:plastocyanin